MCSRYFRTDAFLICTRYDLARVAGWEPYNLHGLGHVSWVGDVLPGTSMIPAHYFIPRTDHRFLLHDLDLPGRADVDPDLSDLPRVPGWEPCSLHDLRHVSWVGSVLRSKRQVRG